jgi:hypothetical protein
VIPARSDNDTGNNPHNPMMGIALAGAKGSILGNAGSENSDSGGNSTQPLQLFNAEFRPTKVDRPSDVVNLVDTGDLVGILSKEDATKVMESVASIGTHGFAIDEQLNMLFVRDMARKHGVGFGGNLKLTLALSLGLLSPREDAIVSLAAGGHEGYTFAPG